VTGLFKLDHSSGFAPKARCYSLFLLSWKLQQKCATGCPPGHDCVCSLFWGKTADHASSKQGTVSSQVRPSLVHAGPVQNHSTVGSRRLRLPFPLAFANIHSCMFQGVLQKVCHRWYLDSHSLHEVIERNQLD